MNQGNLNQNPQLSKIVRCKIQANQMPNKEEDRTGAVMIANRSGKEFEGSRFSQLDDNEDLHRIETERETTEDMGA